MINTQHQTETAESQGAWSDADEAAFQALLDEQNEAYEERVRSSYAARDRANLY